MDARRLKRHSGNSIGIGWHFGALVAERDLEREVMKIDTLASLQFSARSARRESSKLASYTPKKNSVF